MKKIGLLSDTHGTIPEQLFDFFSACDEIWHAGDIGNMQVADQIGSFKPLRAVFGNIDGSEVRLTYPEINIFTIEKIKVVILHIGGYPGHYTALARKAILAEQPDLFISGHSHILKVIYDQHFRLLHINPGAAGKSGFHTKITMVRFDINQDKISNLEIFEKSR
ncbi:MAG TPA: metallophosphoesterase family protein [Bacteroidales bacterium]|nr:metallophosphoesterase family protein [Bacteroidales bacterium]HPR57381.1 metallophosphoesterase family protein [Bacteroidales bacterium]HRW96118.1 metallophosphoesterase family protein [Bacteroidales bacterium]